MYTDPLKMTEIERVPAQLPEMLRKEKAGGVDRVLFRRHLYQLICRSKQS